MSTLVSASGSIDSSSSFVEIDSENTSSSHGGEQQQLEDDDELLDTKANINFAVASEQFLKNSFGTMGGISIPHHHGLSAAFHGYHSHHHHHHHHANHNGGNGMAGNNNKSPFLLPAQLYKSLFASAVLQNPDKINSTPPFPRNLLFSCSEKSPNSDGEPEEKCSVSDEV